MKISDEPSSIVKKSFFILGIWILGIFLINQFSPLKILSGSEFSSVASATSNPVNAWWPTPSVMVSGTQPFKATVEGKSLADYNMFWQVDAGNYVKMDDSQTDSPHKEASVDVSGWNWNSSGVYTITFIAQDLEGQEIGRTSFPINVSNNFSSSSSTDTQTPSDSSGVAAPQASAIEATLPATETKTSIILPSAAPTLEVMSPTAGASLSGTQSVKALLKNYISPYKMYWSVDGGRRNEMSDSNMDIPHKEADIDFTNWNWRDSGTYVLTFTAVDNQGENLGETSVAISVNTKKDPSQAVQPNAIEQLPKIIQQSVSVVPVSIVSSSGLYVDQNSPALIQASVWKTSRPADALIMKKIGSQSAGTWYGEWNANVTEDVRKVVASAKAENAIPTLVAYNIPGRDCGGYSAGGVASMNAYLSWMKKFSDGIGNNKAIVILEPDALSNVSCLSFSAENDRYAMLKSAVTILKANPQARVYLDAGHAGWVDSDIMAKRLVWSGISAASGFSLNVSNFVTTSDNTAYGRAISQKTNNSHFVIDTSRNGSGTNGEWCNPSGRTIGKTPTLTTGDPLIDAYLWIKPVGESDGTCNGGPNAGNWWADYALDMGKRSGL